MDLSMHIYAWIPIDQKTNGKVVSFAYQTTIAYLMPLGNIGNRINFSGGVINRLLNHIIRLHQQYTPIAQYFPLKGVYAGTNIHSIVQ